MRRLATVAILATLASAASAECVGSISGSWEKRPVGSGGPFDSVEAFRIDPSTGVLTLCGRNRAWDSGFVDRGDELVFVYARQTRD